MKTLEAVKDKIFVELEISIDKKSEGGIVIPESAICEPQKYGKVISIGDDVSFKSKLNVGDVIAFHERAGMDIILNRKIYKVLLESEIYGILKEEEI